MVLNKEAVEGFAPDTPSIKASSKLFEKIQWRVYKSHRAVWSEIQGSAKTPYYVQIDTLNIAFKCSCPSRKFPCKHGLALGFYIAQNGLDTIEVSDEPLWVQEWIDKRVKKASIKPKPSIEKLKVVSKKSEKKWEEAKKEIAYLSLWLEESIKLGLLGFHAKFQKELISLKKTFVDKKLIGINRYFSMLERISYTKDGWEEEVLGVLGELYLLTKVVQNHQRLKEPFKKELAMLLGWSVKKEELLASNEATQIEDSWLVLLIEQKKEDNLTSRKVYLYGISSNRWAYILEFSFSGAFERYYRTHQFIEAKLLFFEGILEQRAMIKVAGSNITNKLALKPLENLSFAQKSYIEKKIAYPFLYEMVHFVANVRIQRVKNSTLLIDKEENIITLTSLSHTAYITLLVETKADFFSGFILQQEKHYRLISFYYNNQFKEIV